MAKENETEQKRVNQSGGRFSFSLLFCFLGVLASLGLSGWMFWQQYQARAWPASVNSQLQKHGQQLAVLEDMVPSIKALNEAVESLAAADSKQQQSLNLKLKETLEAVDRRLGVTSEDWIMAEVEYLLRLANQRVRLDDDVPGARKLLQSADQMLRQAEIVTAFEVRQAIASDLLSLDNIQLVDRQGIYARLTAVLGMINGLKERRPDFEPDQPVAQTGASQPDGWRQTLKHMGNRVLGSLARLVDFRRNETPVRPILPPEEDYYLRHNLLLKLELARMALLNSDQQAYDQSLKEAASWVRQYYDDSDNTTMVFLESVKALAELSVVTEKMDMDASIQAIRHYMQRFRSAPPSIDAGRHLQEDERREETTEESAADSPADNGAEQ